MTGSSFNLSPFVSPYNSRYGRDIRICVRYNMLFRGSFHYSMSPGKSPFLQSISLIGDVFGGGGGVPLYKSFCGAVFSLTKW